MMESTTQMKVRLAPVLAQLDAFETSVFLDLCELLLMVSERMDGSLKFKHPRLVVHIKKKRGRKDFG